MTPKIEYVNGDKMVNLKDVIEFVKINKLNCPGFEDNDYDIGWNDGVNAVARELEKLED